MYFLLFFLVQTKNNSDVFFKLKNFVTKIMFIKKKSPSSVGYFTPQISVMEKTPMNEKLMILKPTSPTEPPSKPRAEQKKVLHIH